MVLLGERFRPLAFAAFVLCCVIESKRRTLLMISLAEELRVVLENSDPDEISARSSSS